MDCTLVDNTKLQPWYFAVLSSSVLLERHIEQVKQLGLDTTLDQQHLESLEDLMQFLAMSWDMWMFGTINAKEVVK